MLGQKEALAAMCTHAPTATFYQLQKEHFLAPRDVEQAESVHGNGAFDDVPEGGMPLSIFPLLQSSLDCCDLVEDTAFYRRGHVRLQSAQEKTFIDVHQRTCASV
jgi:hypothetical protein